MTSTVINKTYIYNAKASLPKQGKVEELCEGRVNVHALITATTKPWAVCRGESGRGGLRSGWTPTGCKGQDALITKVGVFRDTP